MIERLQTQSIKLELTDKLQNYVNRKIGKLDTYIPRAIRPAVHAEVTLTEAKAHDKQQFTANVVLHMPGKTLDASGTTINIFAAIDIVEEKLRAQLKKYKEVHAGSAHRQLFTRRKRQSKSDE